MTRSFRACLSTYVILTICFGLIPGITLPSALRGDRDAGWIAAVGIAVLLFVYFWLSRFRVTITPDAVVYSSLFTGERRIRLADVTHTEMICESGLYGRRYLLAVTARGVTTRMNYKVLSREAARKLFDAVDPNQSLPHAGFGRSFDPRK